MTPGTTITCYPCTTEQLLDDQEIVALAEVAMFISAHADCAEFDIRIAIPRPGAEPVRLSVHGE